MLATALITVATVTWQRAREGDAAPRPLVRQGRAQAVWCMVAAAVLLILRRHGRSPARARTRATPARSSGCRVDWETVSKLHAVLAWIVVTLTFALWFVLEAVDAPDDTRWTAPATVPGPARAGRHRLRPVLHGPARGPGRPAHARLRLMWIGVLRVALCLRERPEAAAEVPPRPTRALADGRVRPAAPPYVAARTPAARSPPRSCPPPAARPAVTRRPRATQPPSTRASASRNRRAPTTCSSGRPVGAAGEEDLAERGQLQDLREDGRGPGAGADEGGAQSA